MRGKKESFEFYKYDYFFRAKKLVKLACITSIIQNRLFLNKFY